LIRIGNPDQSVGVCILEWVQSADYNEDINMLTYGRSDQEILDDIILALVECGSIITGLSDSNCAKKKLEKAFPDLSLDRLISLDPEEIHRIHINVNHAAITEACSGWWCQTTGRLWKIAKLTKNV
jgi:hypothetical protein